MLNTNKEYLVLSYQKVNDPKFSVMFVKTKWLKAQNTKWIHLLNTGKEILCIKCHYTKNKNFK